MLHRKEACVPIPEERLDELLKDVEHPEGLFDDAGLMKELKIKLIERMLGAMLTAHRGYEEGKEAPRSDQPAEWHLDRGAEGAGRGDVGGSAP